MTSTVDPPIPPKYSRPKILLMDTSDDMVRVLSDKGLDVASGTFGKPYPWSKDLDQIYMNGFLPGDKDDREIVIIDMHPDVIAGRPEGSHWSLPDLPYPVPDHNGTINPRPLFMGTCHDYFDRVLNGGGVLVIFPSPMTLQRYRIGREGFIAGGWSFLPESFSKLRADSRGGRVMQVPKRTPYTALKHLVESHALNGEFHCSITPPGRWVKTEPLLRNTSGEIVSCEITEGIADSRSLILLFPHFDDKTTFITDLLFDVLPDRCPELFPEFSQLQWLKSPVYEVPEVLKLKEEIGLIAQIAKDKISTKEEEIQRVRAEKDHLYKLLHAQSEDLVTAVQRCLNELGFQQVVNMDEERRKQGDTEKREDLQIRDADPRVVVIEIKGLGNRPKDEDVLTVPKYVNVLNAEDKTKTYQGLSIINHQRFTEPLRRDNQDVFRDLVQVNAQAWRIGLLTTWDLFRLMRSFVNNGWNHQHIRDLFYGFGPIEPIPPHYHFVGTIEKFYPEPNAFIITLQMDLRVGDWIACELPSEFIEEQVTSVQVDGKPVETAQKGDEVGIKTKFSEGQAKKGTRVFRVEK